MWVPIVPKPEWVWWLEFPLSQQQVVGVKLGFWSGMPGLNPDSSTVSQEALT
jgi:hypothetical protein